MQSLVSFVFVSGLEFLCIPGISWHLVFHVAQNERGAYVAAICAGPTALGSFGILADRTATCYPGCEGQLMAGKHVTDPVVVDGNVITSRGVGTAIDFGLKLVEILTDKKIADDLADKIVYKR